MKKLYTCLFFLFLFQQNFAFSQNNDSLIFKLRLSDFPPPTEISQTEVMIGSNVVTSNDKQPVAVTVITRAQMQLSGARNVAEALMAYIPNFFINETQDNYIVGFRGLGPDNNSKVMLLLNGENLNNEFFWGPPDAVLSSLNFDYIERIEVIRGPGSVTLGQGALLGVINIVTKKADDLKNRHYAAQMFGGAGQNGFRSQAAEFFTQHKDFKTYFHAAYSQYDGQEMRRDGWGLQKLDGEQGKRGATVADKNHLKASRNAVFFGNLHYKNLDLNLFYTAHEKNLYNWYRDRDVFLQNLFTPSLNHTWKISPVFSWKNLVSFALDDFRLQSVAYGLDAGGTREMRFGAVSTLNIKELWKNNQTAVGFEYRQSRFGLQNHWGNNFIVNTIDTFALFHREKWQEQVNRENTMGYRQNIGIFSVFAESFQSIGSKLDLFAAFRFDNHPFWGNNLSPRLGFIFAPNNKMRLRLSYQTGFRGVVGLNYGGGYRGDGHLSVQNYDKVAEAQIPLFDKDNNITGYAQNIPKPLPEKIQTIETQINYQIAKNWNIDGTFFYNNIKNVIGVGVIWADATLFAMKKIGSDIPPAWNGYWFFVNTPGTFDQYGAEIVADYKAKAWQINFSHSLVRLANVSQEQVNGLYISSNKRTRVFPENVTRLNILGKFGQKWSTSLNGLYYYEWYAPNGVRVEGNFLLNGTLGYKIGKRIELFATAKNLLNQNRLYPMQSNPGDGTSSPGTPAVEARTFWLRAEMNF